MVFPKIKQNLRALDIILILYILFTGIFIAIEFNKIEFALTHLLFRAGILFLTFSLLIAYHYYPKPLIVFFRNFYVLILLGFLYSETDALNNIFFSNLDYIFVNLDNKLFGNQPSILFYENMPYKWFIELMNFAYFSYYPLIFIFCFILYLKQSVKTDFVIFIICCSFIIYYIIFIIIPVAGPQFYFASPLNEIPDAYLFSKIMHLINYLGEKPTAAFPSSHVGIIAIVLYLVYKYKTYLLKWYIPLAILLIFSTVYLKAHYLIDVFAGIISAPLIFWISSSLYQFINKKGYGKIAVNQILEIKKDG